MLEKASSSMILILRKLNFIAGGAMNSALWMNNMESLSRKVSENNCQSHRNRLCKIGTYVTEAEQQEHLNSCLHNYFSFQISFQHTRRQNFRLQPSSPIEKLPSRKICRKTLESESKTKLSISISFKMNTRGTKDRYSGNMTS